MMDPERNMHPEKRISNIKYLLWKSSEGYQDESYVDTGEMRISHTSEIDPEQR